MRSAARYLWGAVVGLALCAGQFATAPRAVVAQVSAPCGPTGFFRLGNVFYCATAGPSPTPTPTATPTPQPSPSGTILTSEVPLKKSVMAGMRGVDNEGNYPAGGFPWTSFLANTGINYTRGFPTSADANLAQYQAAFAATVPNSSCGNVSPTITLQMGGDTRYNTDTSGTENWQLAINQEETDVAGTTYGGGVSPPALIARLFSCAPSVNGSNEFNSNINTGNGTFQDTVNGVAGWVSLPVDPTNSSGWGSWAELLPSAATAGSPLTVSAPGSAANCGTTSAAFYMCTGNWIYIVDNTATGAGEHVQITTANTTNGTITFTPQQNHTTSAVLTTDITWDMAEWQYGAFLFMRHNTTHPEYNLVPNIATTAFSTISSTANGTWGPVSATEQAFQQVTAGLLGTAYDTWQVGSGESHPYADSVHYHTSSCGQFPPFGTTNNNQYYEYGQFVTDLGVTPAWQQGAFTGENIFYQGAAFGNSGSPVPYLPTGASQCDVPAFATAQYVAVAPYNMRETMPWEYEAEPGLYIGTSGTLIDTMLDIGLNFFPGTYVQANTYNFWNDLTVGSAAMTALQYTNPFPGSYCAGNPSYLNTTSNTFTPTGCTAIHALGESADGTRYTYALQQMPTNGLITIAPTVSCPGTPPGNTGQFGNCPNNPVPSPNPTISPTAFQISFKGIKQANVYELLNIDPTNCDAPTNSTFAAPTSAPSPTVTSTPNIIVANNTKCGGYALIGSYTTTNPTWMTVNVTPTTDAVPTYYFDLSTQAVGVSPLPTITPIPMLTPYATPAASIYNRCEFTTPCIPNIQTLTGT